MLNELSRISIDHDGVSFSTPTGQGVQLVKITMRLYHPTILPSSVSLEEGKIVYRPLSLTLSEVQEFFRIAAQRWKESQEKRSTSNP